MNNMPISGSDGDNNATTIVGGLVIALAIIAVALRFYTRISMKAGLRLDDWLVFLAVVLTMLMAFFVILGKIQHRLREASEKVKSLLNITRRG